MRGSQDPPVRFARTHAAGGVLASVALLAGAAFPLCGCSGPGASSPKPASPDAPRHGGVLRLSEEVPVSLDPAAVNSVYEALPVSQIFDGLVATDPSLNIVPALATTWTISHDGRVYTFHLRPGVRFHDGTPLTADDVVHTFRRLLDPGRPRKGLAGPYFLVVEGAREFASGAASDLAGVEALDDLTVRIRLERPYLSFLHVLAMDGARIVRRDADDACLRRSPVGTGPFRVASWDDRMLRLEANPDYFGRPPYLDAVEILFPPPEELDHGSRRFFDGKLDVLEVSSDDLRRASREPALKLYRYQELNLSFLGLSAAHAPLDVLEVRQAIAHALDRHTLVMDSPNIRREATGILPPGLPCYSPDAKALAFDRAKARILLEQAGYPGGKGMPPVVLYTASRSAGARRVLARIQSDLEAVGIPLEVREVSWSDFNERLERGETAAFLLAWIADLADPDAFLRTLFQSGGSANYFALSDEGVDRLLEEGAREMQPVRRARIYRKLERRILQLAPLVPLYHTRGVLAMRKGIHGLEPGPLGLASVNLEKVWIEGGNRAP